MASITRYLVQPIQSDRGYLEPTPYCPDLGSSEFPQIRSLKKHLGVTLLCLYELEADFYNAGFNTLACNLRQKDNPNTSNRLACNLRQKDNPNTSNRLACNLRQKDNPNTSNRLACLGGYA
ncbi:hypothetical protein AVEN_78334-1 [Araneus ventricosus]|uniref:Uncharacterized protein n=1 Tax=Araneus ventricosus TaxID=182803 RepID=A0A4Y2J3D0_ARAVE|nr:hypothetical protein AVEN_78334-1 [Araneus ventricosus]